MRNILGDRVGDKLGDNIGDQHWRQDWTRTGRQDWIEDLRQDSGQDGRQNWNLLGDVCTVEMYACLHRQTTARHMDPLQHCMLIIHHTTIEAVSLVLYCHTP